MNSPIKKLETDFTVNRMLLASTERVFSSDKAKKDFGYVPKVRVLSSIASYCLVMLSAALGDCS